MHFGLSEEQQLLQETLRGFAEAECPPTRLREIFDAGSGHDDTVWKGLAEMGLAGLVVPEAQGGAGLGLLELALVAEVAGFAGLPGALLEHSLAALAIDACGDDDQRARYLPALASGQQLATVALCHGDTWAPEHWTLEPAAGRLSGALPYVPHAGNAGLLVVGLAGGRFAVLEPREAAGITREDLGGIDRTRPIARLVLEDTPVDVLARSDVSAARRIVDAGAAALAADAFGAASRLIALVVAYAQDRKQFGQPIAQFQAVKHQIARMGTEIEPTRALVWYAAHALDEGLADASRHASMAKAHVTDKAVEAARAAVELHGGLGFTWECDVQMWFKRAMYDRSFLGTPEEHRERMAALAGW